MIRLIFAVIIPSYACAISDGSKVVLTGGYGNRKDVTVYTMAGFERNLPDLMVGRQYHACASFVDIDNHKVNKDIEASSCQRLV